MELGIFCNIFSIELSSYMSNIVICQRSKYPSLKELRKNKEITKLDVYFYADDVNIYGYGLNLEPILFFGFQKDIVDLYEIPNLAINIIKNGFVEYLEKRNFTISHNKGRFYAFDINNPYSISNSNVKLIKGYDFNIFYLFNYEIESINFTISIDAKYKLIDENNKSLNFSEIRKNFQAGVLNQIRVKQGDLLPTSHKINTEISKERLLDYIIPFVERNSSFDLPNGKNAIINKNPIRIVIGE